MSLLFSDVNIDDLDSLTTLGGEYDHSPRDESFETVFDFFEACFGVEPSNPLLRDMTIESGIGADCALLIDRASDYAILCNVSGDEHDSIVSNVAYAIELLIAG